jgi:transcriptional regulator with XRE-family HTH domain
MANRQRLVALGARRGERLCRELGEAVRDARLALGLTQREVGEVIRRSGSRISRIERALPPYPSLIEAARLTQVLGLDLSIRCFPTGAAIRDAAHVKLIARLVAASPAVEWRLEEVMPTPQDLRAWDAVGSIGGVRIGVTAETRLRDVQALVRREKSKLRDAGLDRWLLLLLGSRANRAALREVREHLRAELPLDSREVLRALRRGRPPDANGIVIL